MLPGLEPGDRWFKSNRPDKTGGIKMIDLAEIGFYTLSNDRARNSSINSPLWRCELLITDRCNFNCPYCRGMRSDCKGDMDKTLTGLILDTWFKQGLKNIRFSGGEPTLHKRLNELVKKCKDRNVERIAISTNGSAKIEDYLRLHKNGVDDFSISLDACCSSLGDIMAGRKGSWDQVVDNIKILSRITYVTVGMVFTDDNIDSCLDSVLYAESLGVSDIRVIPSAQYNKALTRLALLPKFILDKYPILNYRISNLIAKRSFRGIKRTDCSKCWLVLDDMAIAGKYHFPCIIYLREQGDPIGKVNENMREKRLDWFVNHNTYKDKICREMCLDVCVDYNNEANKRGNDGS